MLSSCEGWSCWPYLTGSSEILDENIGLILEASTPTKSDS